MTWNDVVRKLEQYDKERRFCSAFLECISFPDTRYVPTYDTIPLQTHTIFVGDVLDAEISC